MKRTITILLAVLLVFGLLTPAALASPRHPFTDVGNTWYSDAVQFVWENDIMTGTSATIFAPGANFTRAQVAATLFRAEHGRTANAADSRVNNFTDVPSHEWFAPYVTWAANRGIVTGASPTIFNPNNNATRQEFAVMLWRFAGEPTGAPVNQLDNFTDRNQIAAWAVEAMRWANQQGIITGATPTTINPAGLMTRAQAALMLARHMGAEEPSPPQFEYARNFILTDIFAMTEAQIIDKMGTPTINDFWGGAPFISYVGEALFFFVDAAGGWSSTVGWFTLSEPSFAINGIAWNQPIDALSEIFGNIQDEWRGSDHHNELFPGDLHMRIRYGNYDLVFVLTNRDAIPHAVMIFGW